VETSHVRVASGAETGRAFIFVEPDGSNTIAVNSGANSKLEPSDLPEFLEDDIVLLQFEIPLETVAAALVKARSAGARTVLSLSPLVPGARDLVKITDLVVCNRGEAVAVTGLSAASKPEQLATELLATGAPTVIVTLGADGIVAAEAHSVAVYPASAITDVRDTTGAGDAFVGALAAALARGESLPTAITIGQSASAQVIGHVGAQAKS
jgi:ribokinase